jgi:hypothetical protein
VASHDLEQTVTKSPLSRTRRVFGVSLASFVAALLLVAGITPAASAAPSSITVRVTTVAGAPLVGASLSAIQVSQGVELGKVDAVETPAKSGTYLFTSSLDSANQYTLFLDTPATSTSAGYQQYWGGGTTVGDARTFTPASGANQLTFSVLASSFSGKTLTSAGKALKSVTVELFKWTGTDWRSIEDVVSAATGAYSFTGLEPGSYTARFDTTLAQPGYVNTLAGGAAVTGSAAKAPANIASATPFYVSYGKPAVLNQKIATGAKITGVVRGSGTPVVGAKVRAIALTGSQANGWTAAQVSPAAAVTTAAGGKFTLAGLAAGTYALSLTPPSALASTHSDPYRNPVTTGVAPQIVTVAAGKTVTASVAATSLTVGNGTTGTVTLGVAGSPAGVAGAIEFVNATGTSKFVNLPSSSTTPVVLAAGSYEYRARPTGRKAVYGTVTVVSGGSHLVMLPYDAEVAMGFAAAPAVAQTATVVGTTYTVTATSNHPTTTKLEYQWLHDGLPIFGARTATYTSSAGDVGAQLAVRVVIRDLEGGASVGAAVNAGSYVTEGGPANATVTPTISPATGVKVGTTLTASTGTWSRPGSYFTYQWRVLGNDIEGATGTTYVVRGGDAMLPITVSVRARKAGFAPSAESISDSVVPDYLVGPAVKKAATLSSKAVAGGKTQYTVKLGTWTPTPDQVQIFWLSDDTQVGTGSTYIYDPAGPNAGTSIRAIVSASKYGYEGRSVSLQARKGTGVTLTGGWVENSTMSTPVLAATVIVHAGQMLTANPGFWTSAEGQEEATFKYQWQRGTTNIAGATAKTYTITGADVGSLLRVAVTPTMVSYTAPVEYLAAGKGTANFEIAYSSAAVAITGDQVVGGKLTAKRTSSWTATGVTDTFQWYSCNYGVVNCTDQSDYTPISGATASTYTIPASLDGRFLSVRLIGTKAGWVSSLESFSVGVRAFSAKTLVAITDPAIGSGLIGGEAMVGERLTAQPGIYNVSGVTLKYEWRYCPSNSQCTIDQNWWVDSTGLTNSYIPGETAYFLGYGQLQLWEIASKKGYPTRTTKTAAFDIVAGHEFEAVAPKFTVSGNKYTLASGSWEGTYFNGEPDFTWLLDGVIVPGAVTKTFTRAPADAGKTLELYVAVSDGESTGAFSVGNFSKTYLVAKGVTVVPAASAIIGNGVNNTLGAPSTSFGYSGNPGASSIAYQWYSAGKAIAGATSSTFTPAAALRGKVLTVKRTFSSDNYTTVVSTSLPLTLGYGDDVGGTPTTTASGPIVPGTVLTGVATGYPTPAYGLAYQWQSSSDNSTFVNISKATKGTYTILPTEVGKFLRVAVTSSRAGYTTVTKPSASVQVLTSGVLAPSNPASLAGIDVNGQVRSGQTLTIVAPKFAVPATTSYRWLRNGLVIPGATSTTYKATGSDYLDVISVEVTAKSVGYSDYIDVTSPATVTTGIAPVASKLPVISGAAKECTTLTASTGTWPVDGVTFSFAWYSNADPSTVIGSSPTYTVPDNTHTGAKLFVIVTATAKGYATATAQSATTAAIANACP